MKINLKLIKLIFILIIYAALVWSFSGLCIENNELQCQVNQLKFELEYNNYAIEDSMKQ